MTIKYNPITGKWTDSKNSNNAILNAINKNSKTLIERSISLGNSSSSSKSSSNRKSSGSRKSGGSSNSNSNKNDNKILSNIPNSYNPKTGIYFNLLGQGSSTAKSPLGAIIINTNPFNIKPKTGSTTSSGSSSSSHSHSSSGNKSNKSITNNNPLTSNMRNTYDPNTGIYINWQGGRSSTAKPPPGAIIINNNPFNIKPKTESTTSSGSSSESHSHSNNKKPSGIYYQGSGVLITPEGGEMSIPENEIDVKNSIILKGNASVGSLLDQSIDKNKLNSVYAILENKNNKDLKYLGDGFIQDTKTGKVYKDNKEVNFDRYTHRVNKFNYYPWVEQQDKIYTEDKKTIDSFQKKIKELENNKEVIIKDNNNGYYYINPEYSNLARYSENIINELNSKNNEIFEQNIKNYSESLESANNEMMKYSSLYRKYRTDVNKDNFEEVMKYNEKISKINEKLNNFIEIAESAKENKIINNKSFFQNAKDNELQYIKETYPKIYKDIKDAAKDYWSDKGKKIYLTPENKMLVNPNKIMYDNNNKPYIIKYEKRDEILKQFNTNQLEMIKEGIGILWNETVVPVARSVPKLIGAGALQTIGSAANIAEMSRRDIKKMNQLSTREILARSISEIIDNKHAGTYIDKYGQGFSTSEIPKEDYKKTIIVKTIANAIDRAKIIVDPEYKKELKSDIDNFINTKLEDRRKELEYLNNYIIENPNDNNARLKQKVLETITPTTKIWIQDPDVQKGAMAATMMVGGQYGTAAIKGAIKYGVLANSAYGIYRDPTMRGIVSNLGDDAILYGLRSMFPTNVDLYNKYKKRVTAELDRTARALNPETAVTLKKKILAEINKTPTDELTPILTPDQYRLLKNDLKGLRMMIDAGVKDKKLNLIKYKWNAEIPKEARMILDNIVYNNNKAFLKAGSSVYKTKEWKARIENEYKKGTIDKETRDWLKEIHDRDIIYNNKTLKESVNAEDIDIKQRFFDEQGNFNKQAYETYNEFASKKYDDVFDRKVIKELDKLLQKTGVNNDSTKLAPIQNAILKALKKDWGLVAKGSIIQKAVLGELVKQGYLKPEIFKRLIEDKPAYVKDINGKIIKLSDIDTEMIKPSKKKAKKIFNEVLKVMNKEQKGNFEAKDKIIKTTKTLLKVYENEIKAGTPKGRTIIGIAKAYVKRIPDTNPKKFALLRALNKEISKLNISKGEMKEYSFDLARELQFNKTNPISKALIAKKLSKNPSFLVDGKEVAKTQTLKKWSEDLLDMSKNYGFEKAKKISHFVPALLDTKIKKNIMNVQATSIKELKKVAALINKKLIDKGFKADVETENGQLYNIIIETPKGEKIKMGDILHSDYGYLFRELGINKKSLSTSLKAEIAKNQLRAIESGAEKDVIKSSMLKAHELAKVYKNKDVSNLNYNIIRKLATTEAKEYGKIRQWIDRNVPIDIDLTKQKIKSLFENQKKNINDIPIGIKREKQPTFKEILEFEKAKIKQGDIETIKDNINKELNKGVLTNKSKNKLIKYVQKHIANYKLRAKVNEIINSNKNKNTKLKDIENLINEDKVLRKVYGKKVTNEYLKGYDKYQNMKNKYSGMMEYYKTKETYNKKEYQKYKPYEYKKYQTYEPYQYKKYQPYKPYEYQEYKPYQPEIYQPYEYQPYEYQPYEYQPYQPYEYQPYEPIKPITPNPPIIPIINSKKRKLIRPDEPYHIVVSDDKKARVLPINITDRIAATNLAMKMTDETEVTAFEVRKGRVRGKTLDKQIEYNKSYKFEKDKNKKGEWYREKKKYRKDSKLEKGKGMNLMKMLYE